MVEPAWQNVKYPKIDFQDISYYSAPKPKKKLASMDEVDPELLRTFEKLGVPMHERAALAGVAVDVILIVYRLQLPIRRNWLKSVSFLLDFRGCAEISRVDQAVPGYGRATRG